MTISAMIKDFPSIEHLAREPGGWIVCRVPLPEMEVGTANLLSIESRPGNLRFAFDGRRAILLGELRDPVGLLTLREAHERLFASTSVPESQVFQVEVASVLDETGHEWSQPQGDANKWQAVVNDPRGCRCDLSATIIQGGVEVCSQPPAWETDLAEASKSALFQFLAAAQGRIRFARFTLKDRKVNAVSVADAARLDVELPDSVAAVVAACQLVWREVSALADTAVAQAYMESMT